MAKCFMSIRADIFNNDSVGDVMSKQPAIRQSDNFAEVARNIVNNLNDYSLTYDEKIQERVNLLIDRAKELNAIKSENSARLESERKAGITIKPKAEDHGAAKWYGQGRKMGD